MRKKFEFEFEDESPNCMSFEYDEDIEEEMEIVLEGGIPFLSANKQAYMALAKIFIKMAMCDYEAGFHVHLRKDLDADLPEVLCCLLKK
ncbi:MAG: hypothetical protein AAFY50_05990 [Cyanobacteria bacterium J06648_1]